MTFVQKQALRALQPAQFGRGLQAMLARARAERIGRMNETQDEEPSLEAFERLARAAFAQIPAPLREACGDVVIQVQDFADQDALDDLDIADPYELTGLYQGVELTHKSQADIVCEPDLIFLYRRPILEEWRTRGDVSLARLIAHVLVHEIGHHFGFSDEDMHRLQDER